MSKRTLDEQATSQSYLEQQGVIEAFMVAEMSPSLIGQMIRVLLCANKTSFANLAEAGGPGCVVWRRLLRKYLGDWLDKNGEWTEDGLARILAMETAEKPRIHQEAQFDTNTDSVALRAFYAEALRLYLGYIGARTREGESMRGFAELTTAMMPSYAMPYHTFDVLAEWYARRMRQLADADAICTACNGVDESAAVDGIRRLLDPGIDDRYWITDPQRMLKPARRLFALWRAAGQPSGLIDPYSLIADGEDIMEMLAYDDDARVMYHMGRLAELRSVIARAEARTLARESAVLEANAICTTYVRFMFALKTGMLQDVRVGRRQIATHTFHARK